jgi:hypothetical protein
MITATIVGLLAMGLILLSFYISGTLYVRTREDTSAPLWRCPLGEIAARVVIGFLAWLITCLALIIAYGLGSLILAVL